MRTDCWFCVYHAYSTSSLPDEKAINTFKKDVEFARELEVKYIIMEDYYKNLNWGEYSTFWNKNNLERMIKIAHENDIKFIPYIDLTELTIKGDIYKKYGREWGAKNRWGKIYSGFNSIFLPLAYPTPYEFFTKLMCPNSGWKNYLLEQAEFLLNELEIDGIYFDRLDYRVICFDHDHTRDHFKNGIYKLVNDIVNEVKRYSINFITIMNDSCMPPDDIMVKCIKKNDFVLSELLPQDWNPYSLYNRINAEWGDFAWIFRRILKPITQLITEIQFTSQSMVETNRIIKIVNRLKKNIPSNKIFLFSHRKDIQGLRAIQEVVMATGSNICYFMGLKKLIELKDKLNK
ncbi:MAG: DUF6259 domain-containing protein [Candidatus Helarchaeota archaeon]